MDALFSDLFSVLDNSRRTVSRDPEQRFAVLQFGCDYVVIRRRTFPDDSQAEVYATKNLLGAIVIGFKGATESAPAVRLMQLGIISGKGGKVGWKCAKYQRIPLAPLEVGVLIESRLSGCTAPSSEESPSH